MSKHLPPNIWRRNVDVIEETDKYVLAKHTIYRGKPKEKSAWTIFTKHWTGDLARAIGLPYWSEDEALDAFITLLFKDEGIVLTE